LPVLLLLKISEILEFRWLSLINGIILAKTMKTWNEELNFLDIIAIKLFFTKYNNSVGEKCLSRSETGGKRVCRSETGGTRVCRSETEGKK
jgi:hypothetical protein